MKIYVLDTHILIWYFIGSKRLKKRAKETIDECRNEGGRLLIPVIVLSEALDIAEKGKVEFDFIKMYQLIKEDGDFEVVEFSLEIFEEVITIKEIKEIHDRVIAATARFYSALIITKDRIIRESGEVELFTT